MDALDKPVWLNKNQSHFTILAKVIDSPRAFLTFKTSA